MGAGMLLYRTPLPVIDGNPSSESKARIAVWEAISRWQPGERHDLDRILLAASAADSGGEDLTDRVDELQDPGAEGHDAIVARIRELLHRALDEVWEANPHVYPNREVIFTGGAIVSGGMSWGDAPTEACNSIDLLDACGVTDITIVTAEGKDRQRRAEIARAVGIIYANLPGDRAMEAFDSVALDGHLIAVCANCGWHVPLDECDQPCDGCGQPGPHQA